MRDDESTLPRAAGRAGTSGAAWVVGEDPPDAAQAAKTGRMAAAKRTVADEDALAEFEALEATVRDQSEALRLAAGLPAERMQQPTAGSAASQLASSYRSPSSAPLGLGALLNFG